MRNKFKLPRRRSRDFRLAALDPRFTPQQHGVLAAFRHDCLAQRGPEEIAASEALGLAALQTIQLTPEQRDFLRGLVREMGAPAQCPLMDRRSLGVCTDENVQCYWRHREHVRASFPQIDDALLRLVCPAT